MRISCEHQNARNVKERRRRRKIQRVCYPKNNHTKDRLNNIRKEVSQRTQLIDSETFRRMALESDQGFSIIAVIISFLKEAEEYSGVCERNSEGDNVAIIIFKLEEERN